MFKLFPLVLLFTIAGVGIIPVAALNYFHSSQDAGVQSIGPISFPESPSLFLRANGSIDSDVVGNL